MATAEVNAPVAEKPNEGDVLAEKTAGLSVSEGKPEEQGAKTSTLDPKSADTKISLPAVAPAAGAVTDPAGPLQVPFEHPLAGSVPIPPAELSEAEKTKYEELLSTVKAWTEIPKTSAAKPEKEPITDGDRLWLTRDCLLRYLRATKWDVAAAGKRLLATLTWRREYGLLGFTHEYISPENETGKQVILGYDKEARPCLYLNPSKQNTERSDKQLHHLFYMVERVIDLMPPGQEGLALLVNFSDTKKGQGSTVGQARTTLNVLQNHYPERLGRALVIELPWYIKTFFSLISPFIDPHTRTKLKFNESLPTYVPVEQLLAPFGGHVKFEYHHSVYWPALDALCALRRRDYHARWVKAGKAIGENELYLRGGEGKSVSGEHTGTEFPEGYAKTLAAS